MANVIKPKRSNTASAVPTTGQLASGELAVNMADQKVYINNGTSVVQVGAGNLTGLGDVNITSVSNNQVLKYDSATSKWINGTGGGGAGDVVGPASATDNAITRFDGSTGTLIQNSTVTINDDGTFANVNGITFDTTPTNAPTAQGSIFWDAGDGTPSVVLNANTSLQLGQENVALVYNGTGSTIARGSVVAVTGAQGQRPSVALADADSESLSAATLGVAAEDITNGSEGFICTFGLVRGLDTSAFTAGQAIYLSQTAGQFTATKPTAPANTVAIGWVIKVNASSGEIFINISNGWELDEIHDVQIVSPANGNTLIYDASAGVWKNAGLTAGTAISVTNGAGSITVNNTGVTSAVAGTGISVSSATGAVTVTNTAPDQTVSLTNGGAIGISGTYPNFTLTNNGVTSVAGTTNQITASASTGSVTLSLPATINVNTTGTASNVTGTVAVANGGTGATTAPNARTNLGATTIGSNMFTLTNPSAVTFPRFNADNTVSALDAATFRTAIGAGTGNGTVTSISSGTGLSGGTITTTGTISLANTTVTAGSYTTANITVDAQGRLTAASNGTAPSPFAAGTALVFAQTAAPTGWTKSLTHDNKALRVVTGTASSGGTVAFTTAFSSQAVSGSLSSTTATNQATTATNQAATPAGSVSVTVNASGSVGSTTLTTAQIPAHSHGVTDPTHNHTIQSPRNPAGGPSFNGPAFFDFTTTINNLSARSVAASTGISINNEGGGGSHTHGFTNPTYTGSFSGNSLSVTQNAHNHTQDAHSHTFTGTAINLAVQYVDVIIATKD